MGHERFTAPEQAIGPRPSAELARRLFDTGRVDSVHIYQNVVTVDVKKGFTSDGSGRRPGAALHLLGARARAAASGDARPRRHRPLRPPVATPRRRPCRRPPHGCRRTCSSAAAWRRRRRPPKRRADPVRPLRANTVFGLPCDRWRLGAWRPGSLGDGGRAGAAGGAGARARPGGAAGADPAPARRRPAAGDHAGHRGGRRPFPGPGPGRRTVGGGLVGGRGQPALPRPGRRRRGGRGPRAPPAGGDPASGRVGHGGGHPGRRGGRGDRAAAPVGARTGEARRLQARVRQRGAVLVVVGAPGPARSGRGPGRRGGRVGGPGRGVGHLQGRRVVVATTGRRAAGAGCAGWRCGCPTATAASGPTTMPPWCRCGARHERVASARALGRLVPRLARRGRRRRCRRSRPPWCTPTGWWRRRRRPGPRAWCPATAAGRRRAGCPELVVVGHDPARDARAFEPVVQAVATLTPLVELTRPGMCTFATRGPSRYHGGDEALAARTAGAGGRRAGPETGHRVLRHRRGRRSLRRRIGGPGRRPPARVIPSWWHRVGAPPSWRRSPWPCSTTRSWPTCCPASACRTLGALAALPATDMLARFGPAGRLAHRRASGLDDRPVDARPPPPDLAVHLELDPPVTDLGPVAFAGKHLADELHDAPGRARAWRAPGWRWWPRPSTASATSGCGATSMPSPPPPSPNGCAGSWRDGGPGERGGGPGERGGGPGERGGGPGGRGVGGRGVERAHGRHRAAAPGARRGGAGRRPPARLLGWAHPGRRARRAGGGPAHGPARARSRHRPGVAGRPGSGRGGGAGAGGRRGPRRARRAGGAGDGERPVAGELPAPSPASVLADPLPAEVVDAAGAVVARRRPRRGQRRPGPPGGGRGAGAGGGGVGRSVAGRRAVVGSGRSPPPGPLPARHRRRRRPPRRDRGGAVVGGGRVSTECACVC